MIKHIVQIRTLYGEVDQMGYVYHANYVSYCHRARTELMRNYGLHDAFLEENNILMPVLSFDIQYKKPAYYDDLLSIKIEVEEMPETRMKFKFKIYNQIKDLLCVANSSVAFVDKNTRKPFKAPDILVDKISHYFSESSI